jgi:hypothetical protein
VRQGDEKPSRNVRAATVSAIVAAVFEDLCARKENMEYALEKIADLLNRLGYVSQQYEFPGQRTDCLEGHVPWDHFRSIFLISPICRTVQMARLSGAQSKLPHSTFQLLK